MPHQPALDGVRGLAILLVLAYHSALLPGGFVGVDLFFALSGFLITRVLVTEYQHHGDLWLLGFWARRALRLVPALLAGVGLAVGVARWIEMPLEPGWALATLLYASNLLIGWGHVYPLGLLSHTWSLGMEEQFYLLWPPLVAFALRWGLRGVAVAAAGLAILPALARLAYLATHPGDPYSDPVLWLRVYFAPDMRFDAIAIGCLAGLGAVRWPTAGRVERYATTVAAALGLAWIGHVAARGDIGLLVETPMLFTLTTLAATAVVLAAARVPAVGRAFSFAPLVGLGKISYGLYLYHVIVFVGLDAQPVWLRWSVAIGLAAVSWWALERPILGFKRRFGRVASEANAVML